MCVLVATMKFSSNALPTGLSLITGIFLCVVCIMIIIIRDS